MSYSDLVNKYSNKINDLINQQTLHYSKKCDEIEEALSDEEVNTN